MMKKTIKVNFKYFWEGFNPENNLFINLLREEYDVIIDENPDFLFYSINTLKSLKNVEGIGKIIKKISPKMYIYAKKLVSEIYVLLRKRKKLNLQDNYVKIFIGSEHIKPNMEECDWAFSSYFDEEINNPRYTRHPPYFMFDYPYDEKVIPPIKKKINFEKIKKEKTKFCNFIYSQDIQFRNEFFKKLNEYKKIDAPGRCMNNMPPIGNHDTPKKSRTSKDWVSPKLKFLKPYKFTIAFENASIQGWITEKLTHPMLVNSIPIYFGHKTVSKEFNVKSFINYHDFENMDKFIEHIIKVDNDDELYKKYLEQPWFNKDKFPKYANKKNYLNRLKEIVELGLKVREI